MEASAEDPLIGQVVAGRYEIQEAIASGGMGIVYRAKQLTLGRSVAVKVLRPPNSEAAAERFRKRFIREAEALAKLTHPNTIIVHDYGPFEGDFFMAMEYVNGKTLSKYIVDNGPLKPLDAAHIGMQIAASLHDAHENNMVHRDLKPGNVMIVRRQSDPLFVKVLDFGLVKVVAEDESEPELTQSGVMVGSPRYMAPEQIKGDPIDLRADIYSFGILMYAAVVGRPPFGGDSKFDVMRAHVYQAMPSFRSVWENCPADEGFEAIVRRCMEKKPKDRFQTMEEVAQALAAWSEVHASGETSPTSPRGFPSLSHGRTMSGSFEAASQPSKQPSSMPLVIALLLSALLLSATLWFVYGREDSSTSVRVDDVSSNAVAPEETGRTSDNGVNSMRVVAKKTRRVRVLTVPAVDAEVRRNGALLGRAPLSIEVPSNESWKLTVSAKGYRTKTISTNASTAEHRIRLKRNVATTKQETTVKETTKTESTIGSGRQSKPQEIANNASGSKHDSSGSSGKKDSENGADEGKSDKVHSDLVSPW